MTQMARFVLDLQPSWEGHLLKRSYEVENVWSSGSASWLITGA